MPPARRIAAGEAGAALIEVVAAAALLVVIAMATFSVLDASGQAAATGSKRAAANGLMSQEQQRLRSLSAVQSLADYRNTRTVGDFTVASQVDPARDRGGLVSCTTDASTPEYLRATTTITWTGSARGVSSESVISPSPGAEGRDMGTLAAQVLDRDANPVVNATVTVAGRSKQTNALGCAVFPYLAAGTYTVTSSVQGWVAPNGSSPVSQSATVIARQTALSSATLGNAATVPVSFATATRAGVTPATPQPAALSLTNPDSRFNGSTTSGAPQPKVYAWQSSYTSVGSLFPFSQPYALYAGTCAGNDPSKLGVDAASWTTAATQPGQTASGVVVQLPTVTVQVTGATGVSGFTGSLAPDTSRSEMTGCTGSVAFTAATNSSGLVSVPAPYGYWKASLTKSSSGCTATAAVPNTDPRGTAVVAAPASKSSC